MVSLFVLKQVAQELCLRASCGRVQHYRDEQYLNFKDLLKYFWFCKSFSALACCGKLKWIVEGEMTKISSNKFSKRNPIRTLPICVMYRNIQPAHLNFSTSLQSEVSMLSSRYAPDFECDQDGNTDCFYHQVFLSFFLKERNIFVYKCRMLKARIMHFRVLNTVWGQG